MKDLLARLNHARPLRVGLVTFASIIFALIGTSWTVTYVIAPQGYEPYALAKPVLVHRVIRQAEVDKFGDQVSAAFGIKETVAAEFADWIIEASERQDIAPELLASLVLTESSFRKQARSNVGAVGPAQVRPDYWGSFCGADDLNDPEQNIYCGAQILGYLLERCSGERACALAAYNVGPYADRAGGAAKRYVSKIDRYQDHLEAAASL
jgi:soluble lytic murein transglycosylase-like protein